MPRMKYYSCILLLISLLLAPTVWAQQADSRWTLGAEIGVSVLHNSTVTGTLAGNNKSWNSTQLANLTADYRVFRWLALRIEGNFMRNNLRRAGRVSDSEFIQAYLLNWTTTTPYFGLAAGPQLLFRVGQGDLALDFLVGTGYRRSSVTGTGGSTQPYEFKFQGGFDPYLKLGLSYTYWPTKRFGINFGGEIGIIPSTTERSRQIKNAEAVEQRYPDTPLQVFENMLYRADDTARIHLTLGVAYRL